MTLVVGYTSPDYVVVATDRMITWTVTSPGEGGKLQKVTTFAPQMTKTVIFCAGLLFTFSGVADLGGHTADWLVDRLTEVDADSDKKQQLLPYIAYCLRGELERMQKQQGRPPESLWFSLMIAGYANKSSPGEPLALAPVLTVMSNGDPGRYGDYATKGPQDLLMASPTLRLRRDAYRLWAIGDVPRRQRLEEVGDQIVRYRRHSPANVVGIVNLIGRLIVERAASVPTVSNVVNVTVVPESSAGFSPIQSLMGGITDPVTKIVNAEYNSSMEAGRTVSNGVASVGGGLTVKDLRFAPGSTKPPPDRPRFAPPSV